MESKLDFTALTERYNHYLDDKDWKKALEITNQMIFIKPKHATSYIYRGFLYYKLGEWDHAEADFRKALTLEGSDVPKWWLQKIAEERHRETLQIDKKTVREDLAQRLREEKLKELSEERGFYFGGQAEEEDEVIHHYLIFHSYQPIRLNPSETFRIGRDWQNDLILPSNSVSRYHSEIIWQEGSYVIYDLKSTNGTMVNDIYIESHPLQNGDVITISNNKIYYQIQKDILPTDVIVDNASGAPTSRISKMLLKELDDKVFSGNISEINFLHILQMLRLEEKSGRLRLIDNETAYVFIEKGKVTHCETNLLEGEEAFFELLAWAKGRFEFEAGVKPAEYTMDADIETLLFEGVRRMDEKGKDFDRENPSTQIL